jgi:hypothetical protein
LALFRADFDAEEMALSKANLGDLSPTFLRQLKRDIIAEKKRRRGAEASAKTQGYPGTLFGTGSARLFTVVTAVADISWPFLGPIWIRTNWPFLRPIWEPVTDFLTAAEAGHHS